ncbi:hypothetical protein IV203_002176 [Nitzschia inconspicua]|uniref:Uncharacterized protein n=1 Tax=Nitzschia inconspicua TaxID=303405 RepID=A0A9K3L8S2_9STRA|nr:hypothetical protein IV203_002176 [Nitzschia inconspicua]
MRALASLSRALSLAACTGIFHLAELTVRMIDDIHGIIPPGLQGVDISVWRGCLYVSDPGQVFRWLKVDDVMTSAMRSNHRWSAGYLCVFKPDVALTTGSISGVNGTGYWGWKQELWHFRRANPIYYYCNLENVSHETQTRRASHFTMTMAFKFVSSFVRFILTSTTTHKGRPKDVANDSTHSAHPPKDLWPP